MSEDTIQSLLAVFPHILPEIVLVAFACVIFLGGTLIANRHIWSGATLLAFVVAMITALVSNRDAPSNIWAAPLLGDGLFYYVRIVALAAGMIFVLVSWNEVGDRHAGDYYGCMLTVFTGLSLTGAANDLIVLFLALELISIPTYVMLYLPKHDDGSQEAALKYFMLSIFSSAILLFGFSYLYGLAGTTNISVLMHTLNTVGGQETSLLAQVALIMIAAGLGFKIAAVPFHFYAPDVYQGTANVTAALLAFVPKAAGFVALLRLLGFVLPWQGHAGAVRIGEALSTQTPILLWFLAAATMTLGNFTALLQTNLRRLFAWSSVAHAGYMLVALAAAPYLRAANGGEGPDGVEAVLYYIVAYGVMTVGAFAVLAMLHSPERPVETVDDLAGLSKTHPWAALVMTIFLFSLIGFPLTAGFTGKFLIFFGAVGVTSNQATLFRVLAVIGMVNAAVGAWYYLRLISVMYLRSAIKPVTRPATIPGVSAVILCALLTVALSIPPASNWMMHAVHDAAGNSEEQRPRRTSLQRRGTDTVAYRPVDPRALTWPSVRAAACVRHRVSNSV